MRPGNTLAIPTMGEHWSDKDIVMLHACFTLLENFVDKELQGGIEARIRFLLDEIEPSSGNSDVRVWAKQRLPGALQIRELYNWWQDYKRRDAAGEIDEVGDDYEEANEMLHRLIRVRHEMWT